jgi:hypothetical protein
MIEKTNKKNIKVIAGFLASALDLEDEMGQEIYGSFLNESAWPDNLDPEAFKEIKLLLAVLINETEEHKKTFSDLQKQLK